MREVARQPRQELAEFKRIQEQVQVLVGERGNPSEAAARIGALRALVAAVPAQPTVRTAAGAQPTADEFNALVADLQRLFDAVNAMRALLQ